MAFAADVSPLFVDFAIAGVLAGVDVSGIFDEADATDLDDGLGGVRAAWAAGGITASDPRFTLPTASVPAAVFGATLTLPQGNFVVRQADADGVGITVLRLTRV